MTETVNVTIGEYIQSWHILNFCNVDCFSHGILYSYLMGVDAIDQTIYPSVLGMTKCSIA
jgi:hypothetical protein